MRFGSLFSGIGGLDLGLERAGMTCAWQVEIDEWCRRVLTKHWPGVPKFSDIRGLTGDELESVDLISGGFPCQPVSRAGRRQAQADERWLWPEFARIVCHLRPRLVLVENVPGLLAHGMGDVLGELASLGYDAEWESLPAAAFGAPHIRERVFVVAHSEGEQDRWLLQSRILANSRAGGEVDDAGLRRHGASVETVFARGRSPELSSWWTTEPDVGRVANGSSSRVDRLRGLGNAVVPQVAEWIGRRIMEVAA